MSNNEIHVLKREIEILREEINTYMEYPEIFKEEIVDTSGKIDKLINEYMDLNNK